MSDPQPQHPQPQNLTGVLAVLTAAVVAQFALAQSTLIAKFAALITKYGVSDLLAYRLRMTATQTVIELEKVIPRLVEEVIGQAAQDGAAAAGSTGGPVTPALGLAGDSFESHAERSARAIREDLQGKLNQLGYRIARFADDAYRAVVADAAQAQVLGLTPQQAQHEAYQKLMRNGIDGFTDTRGRNWELLAYVEMAVRSAAQRAYNVSHLDRMQSFGFVYFYVSDDGRPCPMCAPWQHVVLTTGIPDDVAKATIAEATAAGLFHPNCRHVLIGYTPGVSRLPPPRKYTAEDQRKYDESQQQRAIERSIRAAKRQLVGAFTPEMKTAASKRVRDAQASMRDFLSRTDLSRNSRREQLHL